MPALSTFHGAPMIEATGLSKRYARLTAVDGISFKVEPGEVLGFLGPNGAGKSTTMKIIAGFLLPSGGSARVCGHDVQDEPMAARRAFNFGKRCRKLNSQSSSSPTSSPWPARGRPR